MGDLHDLMTGDLFGRLRDASVILPDPRPARAPCPWWRVTGWTLLILWAAAMAVLYGVDLIGRGL